MKKTLLLALAALCLAAQGYCANIKLNADNTNVSNLNLTVAAAFSDYIYCMSDEGWGICVKPRSGSFAAGTAVRVTAGKMATLTSGERYINTATLTRVSTGNTVKPVFVNVKNVGGGDFNYNATTKAGQCGAKGTEGANNVGMFVRVFGEVTATGSDYFNLSHSGALVRVRTAGTLPAVGDYVFANGPVILYAAGSAKYAAVRASEVTNLPSTILTGKVIRNGTTDGVANVVVNVGGKTATTDSNGNFSVNLGIQSAASITAGNDYRFSIDVSAAGQYYSNTYGVYYNNKIYSSRNLRLPDEVISGASTDLGTIRIIYSNPDNPPPPPS